MNDSFPRGWYTYLYPDGEVLIELESSEDDDSDENVTIH